MKEKENSTSIYSVDQLLKLFVDKKGHILIDENCNPELVEFFDKHKSISNMFKLVKSNKNCPKCNSKLHIHSTVKFEFNNSILMLKTVYECSGDNCNIFVRPKWENHLNSNANYNNDLLDKSLKLGLICNISYEKQSEIIKLFTGVSIPRNKLYCHAMKNHEKFVEKENKIIDDAIKEQKIKFSKVIEYDEQYVLTNEGWKYKMMAIDSRTKYIYDFKIVDPDEFDLDCVYNFLKPIVEENNIKVLSGDGAKINKQVADKLNLKFSLCGYHKMANLMDTIKGTIRRLIQKIHTKTKKIEKNEERIKEIKILRRGQCGRTKTDDKEANNLVDEKRTCERDNRKYRDEIKKYNKELKSLIDTKDDISKCIGSKTYNGRINRYNRIMRNINKYHPKTHSFIKNLIKNLDNLLRHTKHKDIPTTNNGIELCHKHTLNGYDKRKYKTVKGIEREMDLKRIRWNRRCVLGWV